VKILLWHGYLLGGTGSNVYTRALAREWSIALNATAICAQMPVDLVFANHVLLGGSVGWASGFPFAVKAHGSEQRRVAVARAVRERLTAVHLRLQRG
jgi:hypothetical protein